MKYRDWNEMQRKLEALYVLDNALTDPSEEYLRLIRKTEDGDKLHYHVDNGAGDSLSVIFTEKLVLVKGFAHESALNLFAKEQEAQSILERIYAGLPEEYQSLFSLEEKRETTFFLWYDGELHQNSLGEMMVGSGCYRMPLKVSRNFGTLPKTIMNKTFRRAYSENYMKRAVFRIKS